MPILVTVRFDNWSQEKAREVEASHPHLRAQLGEMIERHGGISHRRFFRPGQALDLDEWQDESGYRAFLAEAGPVIDELARLRGTSKPTDEVWQPE